jgi:DNA-binding Lrp family transcriptional regulator
MIEIKEVLASEFMVEHKDLVLAHWQELECDTDLEPDVERYKALEEAGVLKTLGAYVDGEAVGYCSIGFSTHSHSMNTITAMVDAIYIKPEHRGFVGGKLMKNAENLVLSQGADSITWFAAVDSPLLQMLEDHEYEVKEVVMTKKV